MLWIIPSCLFAFWLVAEFSKVRVARVVLGVACIAVLGYRLHSTRTELDAFRTAAAGGNLLLDASMVRLQEFARQGNTNAIIQTIEVYSSLRNKNLQVTQAAAGMWEEALGLMSSGSQPNRSNNNKRGEQ